MAEKNFSSVSIPIDLKKKLEKVVEEGGYGYTSVAELIREAIREKLEKLGHLTD